MSLCPLHVCPLPCPLCELNERKWESNTQVNVVAECVRALAPSPQSMDSAPKDGTMILAYVPAKRFWYAVHWRPGWQDWFSSPGEYACIPTHWMPMPGKP